MFNKLLIELRKKAGLSQNELARLAKLSTDHIAKLEQGRRKPPKKKNLIKICSALNLNEEERGKLLSAAGYSLNLREPLVLSSPFAIENIGTEKLDTQNILAQKNPALKLITEVLTDTEIPLESRKEIEKTVLLFVEWLREKAKNGLINKIKNL